MSMFIENQGGGVRIRQSGCGFYIQFITSVHLFLYAGVSNLIIGGEFFRLAASSSFCKSFSLLVSGLGQNSLLRSRFWGPKKRLWRRLRTERPPVEIEALVMDGALIFSLINALVSSRRSTFYLFG